MSDFLLKYFIYLCSAASFGNDEVIKHLWDHGAQVNIKDVNKMTPFLCAVTAGRLECGRLLLEYGADISALDAHGRCCLHLAVENEQEQMVALLVQNRARSKLVNHSEPGKERTPLHYAAITSNTKVKHRYPSYFISLENWSSPLSTQEPCHSAHARNAREFGNREIQKLGFHRTFRSMIGRTSYHVSTTCQSH